ncbi:MAG: DUF4339 domain-containing protein [Rubripirellula sp.]
MTSDKIYVRFRGRTLGPLTEQKVRDLIKRGQITRVHELSGDGLSWTRAEEFGDFFAQPQEAAVISSSSDANAGGNKPVAQATLQSDLTPNSHADPSVEWYAHINGGNAGPVGKAQLSQWLSEGVLGSETLVWRSGLDAWQPASQAIPELFGNVPRAQSPVSQSSSAGNPYSPRFSEDFSVDQGGQGKSNDLAFHAIEINRRTGWAFFFAIVLIVLSGLTILGDFFGIFVAASGSEAGVNTAPAIFGAIIGILFAACIMTSGILLLQYCGKAKEFMLRPNRSTAVASAKKLSALWAFTGIACMIWLVLFSTLVIIMLTAGVSAFSALR